MTGRGLIAALIALVPLASGGGGGGRPPSITEVAKKIGCHSATIEDTNELYVAQAARCADGSRVLTFASNQARDNFRKIAEKVGGVYVAEGDGYLHEAP